MPLSPNYPILLNNYPFRLNNSRYLLGAVAGVSAITETRIRVNNACDTEIR